MLLDKIFFQTTIPTVTWLGNAQPCFEQCVIDSRMATPNSTGSGATGSGATFFALQGDRVDGHDFIMQAYENGARTFVIARAKQAKVADLIQKHGTTCSVAVVDDVYTALITLASTWRAKFTCPVVGITGSVGKTSTKEMLASVVRLSGKNCLATAGTRNTMVSIATTLLALRPEHDCAIIEMGINKRGEMAHLAQMVRPTIGIITCVAHSHMEGLGSLQDIALEKRDIFKYFKEDTIGIINGDQPILAGISYKHPVVKFGFKTTNQVQARKVQVHNGMTTCILKLYGDRYDISMETIHTGRLLNALACAAAAHILGIDHDVIVKGICAAPVVPGRFEVRTIQGSRGMLINDCYNANPESMKEALLAFERMEARGKKIAVLGDMLELGVNTPFWHRQIGRTLRKAPSLSHVIFVGNHIKAAESSVPRGIPFSTVANWQEAVEELRRHLSDDVAVLVKASNGMGLKNLVEHISGI